MRHRAIRDRASLLGRCEGILVRGDLLRALTLREVQVRYKQAFLGMAWAIFMPFALMLIFTLLKQGMIVEGMASDVPYPVWAYCGLLPWTMHQTALKGCTGSLVTNKNLLAKVYFPRELFPLSKIGAAVVDFLVGLTVLFGLMLWFDVAFTPGMLLLPVVLLLHLLLLTGFGLLLASANLFYRDVQYVFDVFVLLWMFASPVFLDPARSTSQMGALMKTLNPMHPILTAYRRVLLHGDIGDPAHFLHGVAWALGVFLVGVLVFAHREPEFAERV